MTVILRGDPVVTVEEPIPLPMTFELYPNYPNPFNPSTTIQYALPHQAFVSLRLYDVLGRELLLLDEGLKSAGNHSVSLNLHHFSSGVYLYRLSSSELVLTRKLVLSK